MIFSVEETEHVEETDDFEEEPQDAYLDAADADGVDLEEDLADPATALSHAFRAAAASDEGEEDDDDDDDDEDDDEDDEVAETDGEGVTVPDGEEGDSSKEIDDGDTETDEHPIAEAIEALPDTEDLEVDLPPLELPPSEVALFRQQEQDNLAYAEAVKAYYEEKDYQRAIEKFGEAIANEAQDTTGTVTDANSIVAKALYWQAEAYVKLQDISQAVVTFENLIQTCQEHYLSLAAQRRTTQLNRK